MLDLGYATLPRLLSCLGSAAADGIDAVIVTHTHADHMNDLHGLFRARWFGHRCGPPIPLYAPEGVLSRVAALEDDDAPAIAQVFDWYPLPSAPYVLGPFRLESRWLPHFVPNAGIRLSSPNLTIAYTGDTGPDPSVADLGRAADLFIIEATDRHQHPSTPPVTSEGPQMHMTAADAGRAATAARAQRLLLTHFWPGNDRDRSRAEAIRHFTGDVQLGEEGLEVPLP